MICQTCGSGDLTESVYTGNVTCNACGIIVEQGFQVNEVEFMETHGGDNVAVGQFVSYGTQFVTK